MLLAGCVALITGGASKRGLGQATARLFQAQGAKIVVADLDPAGAAAMARELGPDTLGIGCDVTRRDDCQAAAESALASFGRLDILVNNAGVTSPLRLLEVDEASYDRVMDTSMRGTLLMTQAVVPAMIAARRGSIINISSVSAQRGGGVFGGTHYSAAKAAMLGYTKACARELGPHGVRVNAICPGFIDTGIMGAALTPELRARIESGIPLGRAGRAEDVAGCCLFLASELSSYCTGTEVDPNGGMHIH